MSKAKQLKRCPWVPADDKLYINYHDREWGVPVHNDQKIFEFLILEVFQAGLSWRIVLGKRKNFAAAFANFDYNKVAQFKQSDINRLLQNTGIIRNRAKIAAAVNNARCLLRVRREFGSFAKYMWSFVGNSPIVHKIKSLKDYQPHSKESIIWSKDLKKRGFKFLGPVTAYSHMQAVGMINDHSLDCFRHQAVKKIK